MKTRYWKFFLIISLLLVFIMAARTPVDTDMWWHLRAGQTTLDTRSPLTTDYFSHTREGAYWNNHSWLAQVIFYLSFTAGGFLGISLLVSIFAVFSMWLTFLQMQGKPTVNAFLLIFGAAVASVNWVPRPQMISLVFLSLTSYILFLHQKQRSKALWTLPILFILWGNLHGGYALGLILIGCHVIGQAANRLFAIETEYSWKEIAKLIGVGFSAYLFTAFNPNGIKTWFIPFQTVGVEGLQNLISEWASPDFHEPLQLLFLAFFFLAFWSLVLSGLKINFVDLIKVSIFGLMAFMARRNFGPFVIAALPVVSLHVASIGLWERFRSIPWLSFCTKRRERPESSPMFRPFLNYAILLLLAAAGLIKWIAVNQQDFVNSYILSTYPVDAIHWIDENLRSGNLMNEYNWGGFILWSLPAYPVFIDGRTDLYGDSIIKEWVAVLQCGEDWEQIVNTREIDIMLLQPDRAIVRCAQESSWEILFQDELAVVLVKSLPD